MNNLTKSKTLLMIAVGIFIIAIAQITNHFVNIGEQYDFAIGAVEGLGLGLMIIALINGNFKKKVSH